MFGAVMCILVKNRTKDAPQLQSILTNHGCIIKTRVGMHEVANCAEDGLIMLHLSGKKEAIDDLEKSINSLSEIRARTMLLDY
ncbi:hypothetical protein IMX26_04655 [Clostridium sp. 'deep sea']|uniref:hypothetical protein n=1 Tax=Clostridium sp. 'deep sea' TaxID=2779445 RepID=UPI0018967BDF|nr:hypothetical protein [Clostridium sp. 'deep sea']QOR36110.1 hypothetical protein IMX26_04655 [Clostridium sp. 'deep sea']